MKPGGTYGGVPLTHRQAELLRTLWREPGATGPTVMAAFAARTGRTTSHCTAYNHRPRDLPAPRPAARSPSKVGVPRPVITPEQERFLADAWREPGATADSVGDAFFAAYGRRPARETLYARRPADVAPAVRRGHASTRNPYAPPRARRVDPAVRAAIVRQVFLGPPPPPPARVPVAAPGPLTPGQEEALARLWAQFPHRPAADIAARFADATGRLIDAATAERLRPLPPLTDEERLELEARGDGPAAGVLDDEDKVKDRIALMRRAVAQRPGFHGAPFPTIRGLRPTDPRSNA